MTSPLHRKAGNIDVKELLSEPYTGTDFKGTTRLQHEMCSAKANIDQGSLGHMPYNAKARMNHAPTDPDQEPHQPRMPPQIPVPPSC